MWICRFKIKHILLFHFRLTVLWKFLNELLLAKELDVTATIFSSYKLPLYNLNPWIVVYMNRYFMFIHLQFNFCIFFFARGDFNFDWLFFIKLFWWFAYSNIQNLRKGFMYWWMKCLKLFIKPRAGFSGSMKFTNWWWMKCTRLVDLLRNSNMNTPEFALSQF